MIADPRHMSISERYGVEVPSDALRRILVERLGQAQAEAILAEYRAAGVRYQRAVRIEKARRHIRQAELRGLPRELWKPWLVRDERIVTHADRYIATGEVPT